RTNSISLSNTGSAAKREGGEAGDEGFPSETLFHFRIVVARDGIADEQDAREIAFVRMRDPNVTPLDGFAGGRRGVRFSDRNAACKSSRQAKRADQIDSYLHNGVSHLAMVGSSSALELVRPG